MCDAPTKSYQDDNCSGFTLEVPGSGLDNMDSLILTTVARKDNDLLHERFKEFPH
jgi:hypothetical protein